MSPSSRRKNGYDRMSKNYASHSCVSRVKSPVHSRFATYPDVSYRTRTCIGGQKSPVLSIERMRRSGHRVRTDIAGSKVLSDAITPDRKCTDGFEPSRMVLQTTLITRSCAQRWTVFELTELLRIFSPPLLPSQLTVLFCRIAPAVQKQDTKNSMIKSHGAIG